jgi:serine phosphatase RsbU (regulator of sigma subunit)
MLNGPVASARELLAQERQRRQKATVAAKTKFQKARCLQKRPDASDIEWEAARRIQQRLFPAAAPALDGFEIAGMTAPAAATGGDYFDYAPCWTTAWGSSSALRSTGAAPR